MLMGPSIHRLLLINSRTSCFKNFRTKRKLKNPPGFNGHPILVFYAFWTKDSIVLVPGLEYIQLIFQMSLKSNSILLFPRARTFYYSVQVNSSRFNLPRPSEIKNPNIPRNQLTGYGIWSRIRNPNVDKETNFDCSLKSIRLWEAMPI